MNLVLLADIHQVLYEANVNVYASNGVTDSKGSFGYLLYVRPEEYERAADCIKSLTILILTEFIFNKL